MIPDKKLYSFVDESVLAEHLAGDIIAFDDLFTPFIIRHRFINDDIGLLLAEGKYEDARLLAHSVANSAAPLGISSLESTAQALENSISRHNEAAIEMAIRNFNATLAGIIQEISD